ncbi:PAS domain-containing protein [Candidatus Villigracilis affinis]|uniref:PAS domain-containing protein n=1 Tax=Candidatus Villigracilis affinis TaxID=3140682 RepID=UPI0031E90208
MQESEAKFRVLVEHLPTVVYINAVGDTTSTLYVSPQIETLLGYTPEEWLADPKFWLKTLHPEDRQDVLTHAVRTDQSNEPFHMEYRMIARDGRLVWVHDQVVLVSDPRKAILNTGRASCLTSPGANRLKPRPEKVSSVSVRSGRRPQTQWRYLTRMG